MQINMNRSHSDAARRMSVRFIGTVLVAVALAVLMTSVCSADYSQRGMMYSNAELDEILAPIALYPDPLIAQILPAATYPDQLFDAIDFTRQGGRSRDIDRQDWDVSVKAVAYYPTVLKMMADNPDWTTALGQAYVDEPGYVMRSIQRLRARARQHGYLSTNRYQRVYADSGYIRVVPVQPRYIYVPQYDSQVYVQKRSSDTSNLISFGLGLLIGAWLNRDIDYGHQRVYYHGWDDGGWTRSSRSYVNTTNNYYVNNYYQDRPITVDRNVRMRDIGDYRTRVKRSAGTYRLPGFRQPSYTVTARSEPGDSRQSSKWNKDRAVSGSNPWAKLDSSRTPARSSRSYDKPNPNSGKGEVRSSWNPTAKVDSSESPRRSDRPYAKPNTKSGQGEVRSSWSPRTKTPSSETPQRSSRSYSQPIPKSGQGEVRQRGNPWATADSSATPQKPSRSYGQSNPKSDQSEVRRNSGGRNNSPYGVTPSRSKAPTDGSYARPEGSGKQRASGGSIFASAPSESKSNGRGRGRSKND